MHREVDKVIVINPIGSILIKCKTLKQANDFVKYHVNKHALTYKVLLGKELHANDYKMRDLDCVLTYQEWKDSKG